jgi:hypothetical protein
VGGYAVATWDRPHRTAILALIGIAVFGGYVITHLPAAAIMRSRWREPFFLFWTAADVALIALVVTSDGGDWSPLRATFFKRVNDTRGHAAGDDLLCAVARTLAADLRPSDVLGRLGGDEFAVLLPEAGPGELRAAAARLEQRLGTVAAASIGLATLPVDGLTAEDLHRAADTDLYRAKQRRVEREAPRVVA